MKIQPSQYMWNGFKDKLHFYLLLGIVPLALITTYANVFIGQATLTEIPEGYTPHYWEYYKSPITRFLAKYFLYDKSLDYETHVARVTEDSEIIILRKIERELKAMMATKSDNKAWYYMAQNFDDERFTHEWEATEPFRYFGTPEAGDPPGNQM
ncbi:PREDICTED: NADH dehydrogenase [ubiquinone] 1 beta subcomplex subunit 5, mitochondrial-like, partial [Rhagoletis zephyria]|uniref:NADH dehydrogenase [ubiquinone] 1 beta subcomplex subunit 5, mitochondrial-like n=1 Tax=Rhagoletis zephyria TaxID=28612 RepID=UPI0008112AB1